MSILTNTFDDTDMLLIVPPFKFLEAPSYAAHSLQAAAKAKGIKIDVFYADLAFISTFGLSKYQEILEPLIIHGTHHNFWGERLFCRSAYNIKAFGLPEENIKDEIMKDIGNINYVEFIVELESKISNWITNLAKEILRKSNASIFGFSTTHHQTAASIALINELKKSKKDITTVIGGSNCRAEMSLGIGSLSKNIDYIFNGDGEISLTRFLCDHKKGVKPKNKIIECVPVENLDAIPDLDYANFITQLKQVFIEKDHDYFKSQLTYIPYQTSRGCWWGQVKPCAFCGINGMDLSYRAKSPRKVIRELKKLITQMEVKRVVILDSIIPKDYFKTLIPKLKTHFKETSFFYEVKPLISFEKLHDLKKSGVEQIQLGIESFSTESLIRMNKGHSAATNLNFLRWGQSLGLKVYWNILYSIPGDSKKDYDITFSILPNIIHFSPPYITKLRVDRFSAYHKNPNCFGIKSLNTPQKYYDSLPGYALTEYLPTYFEADYDSYGKDNELEISSKLFSFASQWEKQQTDFLCFPRLELQRLKKDKYLLIDSRFPDKDKHEFFLNHKQACAAIVNRKIDSVFNNLNQIETQSSIDNSWILSIDNWHISIVTADPKLLLEFQNISMDTQI